MAQRSTVKKQSSDEFKITLQESVCRVFTNGGGMRFDVSPLNHQMRLTFTVHETYCLDGTLLECIEVVQSAFTADKPSA
jgi:hypothetical protein